jgi:hypothetical protein
MPRQSLKAAVSGLILTTGWRKSQRNDDISIDVTTHW